MSSKRVMKKQFLLLQILIFALVQTSPMQVTPAYSADGTRSDSSSLEKLTEFAKITQNFTGEAIPQNQNTEATVVTGVMPRNYRLPDMYLVDSTAFLYKFRDQVGKRITVEGFIGRYGATFGKDFKEQIYKIEQEYRGSVEIILTLESTIEDAKILKRQMDANGHNMTIVSIPDWFQKRLHEHAEVASQGKLKELLWETKQLFKRIAVDPKGTLVDAAEIIKNQYVKPTKKDIRISAITTTVGSVAVGAGMLSIGVDPITIAWALGLKVAFVGPAGVFNKFIANLLKTDFNNELKVMSGLRRLVADAYYAVGTSTLTSGGINGTQFLETASSALAEGAANMERERRIKSERANNRLSYLSLAIGAMLGYAGASGMAGPTLETAYFQVTTLHGLGLLYAGVMFGIYKYKPKAVQKIAEADLAKATNLQGLKALQSRFRYKPSQFNIPATCGSLFQ